MDPSRVVKDETTYVINHEFCRSCLSDDEAKEKDTLNEVESYAELKSDPNANLPPSFTICSSVMTTHGGVQTFFTLLGKDNNKWMGLHMAVNNRTSFFSRKWSEVTIPPTF